MKLHVVPTFGWQIQEYQRVTDLKTHEFRKSGRVSECREPKTEGFESGVIGDEDKGSIESVAKAMPERTGRTIDVLFNNGAYAGPCTVEDLLGSRWHRGSNSVAIGPEDPGFTSAVAPGSGP